MGEAAERVGLEGGALGGGGGGTGTPTGGGGGGGGAPLPFTIGGGGGAPLTTGTGGGGGGGAAAAGVDAAGSLSGSGGTFALAFGGCLMGKSSYSAIFFLDFLLEAATPGGLIALGGEGLAGLGGKGGSGLSVSGETGSPTSLGGRGGILPLVCIWGICGRVFSGSLGGKEGIVVL